MGLDALVEGLEPPTMDSDGGAVGLEAPTMACGLFGEGSQTQAVPVDHLAQLVASVKAFQRQGVWECRRWRSFADAHLGGRHDPAHTARRGDEAHMQLLRNFLDQPQRERWGRSRPWLPEPPR